MLEYNQHKTILSTFAALEQRANEERGLSKDEVLEVIENLVCAFPLEILGTYRESKTIVEKYIRGTNDKLH